MDDVFWLVLVSTIMYGFLSLVVCLMVFMLADIENRKHGGWAIAALVMAVVVVPVATSACVMVNEFESNDVSDFHTYGMWYFSAPTLTIEYNYEQCEAFGDEWRGKGYETRYTIFLPMNVSAGSL